MRIGLYGLPCSGKTYILDRVRGIDVFAGSKCLKTMFPDFDERDEDGKRKARSEFAAELKRKGKFIMDGHYSFGDNVVFTEADGQLYDVIIYLYINPKVIETRMTKSLKNRHYSTFDIVSWQKKEIDGLRKYCQKNYKDFYVIDNPSEGFFEDVSEPLAFIDAVCKGFSCVQYAKSCATYILKKEEKNDRILLLDGDRTITLIDTCRELFDYQTDVFDGNFYTGYQSWRHHKELEKIDYSQEIEDECKEKLPKMLNGSLLREINGHSYILTLGHPRVWEMIAGELDIDVFGGNQISADTKCFIAKILKENGKNVVAFGDSLNDYYMLMEANRGVVVERTDGSISKSLKGKDLGGLEIVRAR